MLTERIFCPCGTFIRATQHAEGVDLHETRMQRPVEYCSNCSGIMEPDDHRTSEQQVLDIEQQAKEIAAEHDFDRDVDHSQPHDPTDLERELEGLYRDDIRQVVDEGYERNQRGGEDEFDEDNRYIGTMPTASEVNLPRFYPDSDDLDERLVYDYHREYMADNPGYKPCRCEDYPCCGH